MQMGDNGDGDEDGDNRRRLTTARKYGVHAAVKVWVLICAEMTHCLHICTIVTDKVGTCTCICSGLLGVTRTGHSTEGSFII